jgi:hypothetical protein
LISREPPTVLINEKISLYVTGALLKTDRFCFIDLKSNEKIYVSAASETVTMQIISLSVANVIKKYV